MADFVSRSKVEFELCGGNLPEKYKAFVRRVLNDKNLIPSADVAPVVHGRWDDIPNTYMSVASKDGTYHGNATSCSVCHEVNPNAYKTNYCPNCGAKMDGGDPDGR